MSLPRFVVLYVRNVAVSAEFYGQVLGAPALEQSPGFAMFALGEGVMLGLWLRADVLPAATVEPGASELCLGLPGDTAVDAAHADWQGRGLPVIEAPTRHDFGYAFTAVDPDGHRVRFFSPTAG